MMRFARPLHASITRRHCTPAGSSNWPLSSALSGATRRQGIPPSAVLHTFTPMGVHISTVVAAIAALPGLAAWSLRHMLPLPVSCVLWHVSGSGLVVAVAASEALAGRTTGLLGKVGIARGGGRQQQTGPRPARRPHPASRLLLALQRADGTIDPVRFTLLWPYHVGLRAKLALQRRFSSEPSFDQVTPDHYIGAWPSEQNLVPTVRGHLPGWPAGRLQGAPVRWWKAMGWCRQRWTSCTTSLLQGCSQRNPAPRWMTIAALPRRRCTPLCWT